MVFFKFTINHSKKGHLIESFNSYFYLFLIEIKPMKKLKIGVIFFCLSHFVFAQQSKNYYWPKKMENEYLRGCVLGAKQANISQLDAERVCSCNLKKVKKIFPDYRDLNSKATVEQMQRISKSCAKEVGI